MLWKLWIAGMIGGIVGMFIMHETAMVSMNRAQEALKDAEAFTIAAKQMMKEAIEMANANDPLRKTVDKAKRTLDKFG